MQQRKEAWYRNPFRLGGLGMIALLGGFLLLSETAPLEHAAGLRLVARLTYLAGLATVVVAAVLWFVQAQAPEQPIEPDVSEEEAPDQDDDGDDFEDD